MTWKHTYNKPEQIGYQSLHSGLYNRTFRPLPLPLMCLKQRHHHPCEKMSTTQTADEHRIQVTGTVTEKDFHDKFKALCIADAEPLTEKIDYKQVPGSSLQEERYLQMGD